jgi:peptidyl-prolyl cis-trans isomerase B (cyclophilin B)
MKRLLILCCVLIPALAAQAAVAAGTTKVRLVTNMGDIVLALDGDRAPLSVDNFLQYARDGFYDGTIFHRVIDGFMIQGGGFTEQFERKQTRAPIRNEADNGLTNDKGTIAMARTGNPHSATAQFFINVKDNDSLNHPGRSGWGYAVFGRVAEGMEVVDRIRSLPTGRGGPFRKDVPRTPVIIQKAVIEPAPEENKQ